MRKSQKIGIIGLALFWLIIFMVIAVFYFVFCANLFISMGTPGIIIGSVVFIYLIFFSLAMQP